MQMQKVDDRYPLVLMESIEELTTYGIPAISRLNDSGWMGGMTGMQAVQAIRTGHLASVEESDEYLNAFESLQFKSRKWETMNDVAGGAVNVGAHLAGSPLSMRRRQAKPNFYAPLTIFCDVTSGAGILASYLKKRGAAVVALARMLSSTRPVTIYAVSGVGDYAASGFCVTKVDPNDLSRTAFVLAHTAAQRGVMYGTIYHAIGRKVGGWPFNDPRQYRKRALRIYANAVQANLEDCLYVPAILHGEQDMTPEKWLPEMLEKYGVAEKE